MRFREEPMEMLRGADSKKWNLTVEYICFSGTFVSSQLCESQFITALSITQWVRRQVEELYPDIAVLLETDLEK